jgi:DNA-binding NtrC family response regulator
MARVRLLVTDPATRYTLQALLERDGHSITQEGADVIIVGDLGQAFPAAAEAPTLVLATATQLPNAAAALREGIYGYVLLPLEPGEVEIRVRQAAQGSDAPGERPLMTLEEAELEIIRDTVRRCGNNRAKAARVLGIGRNTLWRKLKKSGEGEETPGDAS